MFSIALAFSALTVAQAQPDLADLATRAGKAYREGRVAEARTICESLLSRHARSIRALAGLGKIDLIEHRRESALRHLALAYQMEPDNPEVVRDFAAASSLAGNKALEMILLERLTNLREASAHDREVAQMKLMVDRGLAGRPTNVLLSGLRPYRIRMPHAYSRDWHPYGWTLSVRINGKEPLRLLVDTGARSMLLFRAKNLGLEPLAESSIGGFGDGSRQAARTMLAKSVAIDGQLQLGNVVVEAVDRRLADGVDGLISPDVFEQFLVTLDGPKKTMELTPLDPAAPREGFQAVRRVGHLWLLENAAGEQHVLDTGSSYTVIHDPAPSLQAETISLYGVSGEAKLARVSVPVEVSLGGSKTWTREAVSANLEPISEQFGIRISGFLGFPAVKRLRMSIDARTSSIRIER